jgi:hypothetical protein
MFSKLVTPVTLAISLGLCITQVSASEHRSRHFNGRIGVGYNISHDGVHKGLRWVGPDGLVSPDCNIVPFVPNFNYYCPYDPYYD